MNFLNPKKVISQATVSAGAVVADFGFGKGEFLRCLTKEVGEEGKIYAIDIQENIVSKVSTEILEEGIKNIEFLNVNLELDNASKLADSSVDFILISSLFFQTENKEKIAQEALRILKIKGRILFIDWKGSFSGIGPDKELIFSEEKAILFWKRYPLTLERRIDSGKYHYALIYRKD